MRRAQAGFTLVELLVVTAVIALLAALALPNLLSSRLSANETAAVATLRNLIAAQGQFQGSGRVDADKDGRGEFGGFVELSGAAAGRMDTALRPAVLSGSFRALNAQGEVTRSGYVFRVYLPDAAGLGVGEPQAGFANDGTVGTDPAEATWCCYAWPMRYAQTGHRTFFTNQAGDIVGTEHAGYSGPGRGPAPDAVFPAAGPITASLVLGAEASDGRHWRPVQ